jgi:IS5 family transposase
MLTLVGEQVECLWDEVLPIEVRELPDDLAGLDRVLSDGVLLFPIAQAWAQGARERGRPSISMEMFVRLMVINQRTGWGYETLVREVSDSLHLRRFCLIAIDQRVPDESTVRKLARRLGASVVQEITRMVIEKARRETRFTARAARIDSTVVEADIRYPSDAVLALQGARTLAREGKKLQKLVGGRVRVRDRSRSVGRQGSACDLKDTGQAHWGGQGAGDEAQPTGWPTDRPVCSRGEATRRRGEGVGPWSRRQSETPGRQAVGRAGESLSESGRADRPSRPRVEDHRPAGVDRRSGSPPDPQGQARQTDRVRVRRPDLRDHREHPQRRPRVDPPSWARAREPRREQAAAHTTAELDRAGIRPREIVADGGFMPGPTKDAFPDLDEQQIQISGRHEHGSRRTRKRRARHRTGIEGRISHLKRGYGLRRSRLKGDDGMQIWTGWAILAYDLDTLAIRTR